MFLTFLLIKIIFLCTYIYFNERHKRKQNWPPGPIDLPLIGGVLQFLVLAGLKGHHYKRAHRISKHYGPLVYCRGGSQRGIIVEDFNMVKEILNSPEWEPRFPNHPRFLEHIYYKHLGLMSNSGKPHLEMRKFTIKTLKKFGFGEPKRAEEYLQLELFDLINIIENRGFENDHYMHHFFKVPTFNILWQVMAGYRFSLDDEKIKGLIHAAEDCNGLEVGLDPEWSFPFLRYIPGCSPSRSKRGSFFICHAFFWEILWERQQNGLYKKEQNDFIDYFLLKIDEEKDNPDTIYTEEMFVCTCVDLLFAGLDTTSQSLEFALIYMIKNPKVQAKAQDEIDLVVGKTHTPSVFDRNKLKYCEAVMWEVLRLANIVPLLCRTSACPVKLGGHDIPENIFAGLNLTMINYNKTIWKDPQVFCPERFLDDNNNLINTEKIFAFGGGKRKCPGYLMAKVKFLAFFTGLLQRYTFTASPYNPEISDEPIPGITNAAIPFYCMIKPRSRINVSKENEIEIPKTTFATSTLEKQIKFYDYSKTICRL